MIGLVLAAIVIGTAEAFVGPPSAALLSLRARLPAGLSFLRVNSCVHVVHVNAYVRVRFAFLLLSIPSCRDPSAAHTYAHANARCTQSPDIKRLRSSAHHTTHASVQVHNPAVALASGFFSANVAICFDMFWGAVHCRALMEEYHGGVS